jgi:diguanylate cyclase (GGDEF)-like protein
MFALAFADVLHQMIGKSFISEQPRIRGEGSFHGITLYMFFSGVFQGQFQVTLSYAVLGSCLDCEPGTPHEEFEADGLDLFQEVLNAAAQVVMVEFQKTYGDHQMIPPSIAIGEVRHPRYLFFSCDLASEHGDIECTLLINMVESGIAQILARTEERLMATQEEAIRDPLTKMYNRRHFERSLATLTLEAQMSDSPFTMAMVDLDNFKGVNDRWGHDVGDRVLITTAQAMTDILKDGQLGFRTGGDEFCILFPQCTLEESAVVCEAILARVRNTRIESDVIPPSHQLYVTLSIGVAQYQKGSNEIDIVKEADRGVYMSKDRGRACVSQVKPL